MMTRVEAKVLEASYVDEADSIVILAECEHGQFRHQINSSCFSFNGRDKRTEMIKTADLLINKKIWLAFNKSEEDQNEVQ